MAIVLFLLSISSFCLPMLNETTWNLSNYATNVRNKIFFKNKKLDHKIPYEFEKMRSVLKTKQNFNVAKPVNRLLGQLCSQPLDGNRQKLLRRLEPQGSTAGWLLNQARNATSHVIFKDDARPSEMKHPENESR